MDGYNGFEYDGTDQDLIDKIRVAIDMLGSGNAKIIQKNAQDYVSKKFSMEKMTDSYLELYNSLIKHGKFN